ncbi:MAG: hypothetical protein GXC73_19255 [Chitinophagaceae bacterium]|nr:hypothetical protein [Chitinophagaceae bacterium]
MRTSVIRRLISAVVGLVLFAVQVNAQLNHFIYLQSDNQQPFYIKYNNRIISSSTSGYLILPKLKDGVVDFAVGFPKSDQSEQQFQYTIDKADKGFLLKNFNDKGWGLYDLQTSSIVYAATKQGPAVNTTGANVTPANDPFSNMLSKVTQDSTVKTVTVVKEEKPVVVEKPKEEKPSVVTTAPPVKDTVVIKAEVKPEIKEEKPVITEPEWTAPSKSTIKQVRKFISAEGADMVFEVAEASGAKDTIRVFIERDPSVAVSVNIAVDTPKTETVKKDTVAIVEPPKVDTPVISKQDVEEKKEQVTTPVVVTEPAKETKTTSLPNSNCKDFATEDDLVKLRRRMASQRKDEQMVEEAKKVFKTKCFTSGQLRVLSALFLTDEGRYRFFDAALPFVTDFTNFKSLGDTIQDEYYKRRFTALLPNQ